MNRLNFDLPFLPKGYGRSIPIIIEETVTSFIKEKRFYISIVYYVLLPIILVLGGSGSALIQTGTGIAIYYAQLNTSFFIKSLFLTFFPGQIFLVILSSDQIAGEVESDTLSLVLSRPTYHSEIIIGKYLGLLTILAILQIPSLSFIYYFNLIRYGAAFPFAFWSSLDEFIAMLIIILLIQSMILALALLISSTFDRSLYAILSSILGLFVLSSLSDTFASDPSSVNYMSLPYYVDSILPSIFFNLEPLEKGPNVLSMMMVILVVVAVFQICSVLILRRKELY